MSQHVKELVEDILNETINATSLPLNYKKKIRTRLRKSMKKQITERMINEPAEPVVKEIKTSLKEKYSPSKVTAREYDQLSDCSTPTILVSLTNSENSRSYVEENSLEALRNLQNTQLMEDAEDDSDSGKYTIASKFNWKRDKVDSKEEPSYLVREINCLKEVNEILKARIGKQKRLLKSAKTTNLRLMSNNRILGYRSSELGRRKIAPYISQRTVNIVDAAVYSEFFGYLDSVILDTPITIVKLLNTVTPSQSNIYKKGEFRTIHQAYLKNGEGVVLKRVRDTLCFSEEKCLSVLSVEARVSKLIGKHPNVADCIGLFMYGSTSFIVQMFESDLTLKRYLSSKPIFHKSFLSCLLKGIKDGILHVYSKGIIINNITTDNIVLKISCQYYTPVITSLSLACREESAKPLTTTQQLTHKENYHLPLCVRNGTKAPSFMSDLYSFGHILGHIGPFGRKINEADSEIRSLSTTCFMMRVLTASMFNSLVENCCDLLV